MDTAAELPPIVLVVEDHTDTREMYESGLGHAGIWVDSVAGPDDAFDHAIDLRPDAVLMDVGLPQLEDGVALAQAFRDDPRLATTPILAVTALTPPKLAAATPLFSQLLFKPVDLATVIRELRSLSLRYVTLRKRYEEAASRVPPLLSKATEVRQESERLAELYQRRAARRPSRDCPRCHEPLRFTERGTLDGVTYDYYLPCENRCGLYCWDNSQGKMITLIG